MRRTLAQMQIDGFTSRGFGLFDPATPLSHLAAAARRFAPGSAVVVLTDRADAWLGLPDRPLVMEFDPDLAAAARVTVESLCRAGRPVFVIADIDYRDDVAVAENELAMIRYAGAGTWLVRDHTRAWPHGWRFEASSAEVSAHALDDFVDGAAGVTVTDVGEIVCDAPQSVGVA